MPLLIVGIGIIVLLILVSYFKLSVFLSLVITSFTVGILSGMNLLEILESILTGIGDTLGKIILILAFGAILGKLLEESGAAHAITYRLTDIFGLKRIQYALLLTGLLVGLPMMYNAGFLVLIPLVYTFASSTKLPMVWLAIPLCSALSVTHCFLPPHPAPTYVAFIYGANVNKVLLYGLIPMIPACLLGGILFSGFSRKLAAAPPTGLYQERNFSKSQLPGLGISILCATVPVILMLLGAITDLAFGPPPAKAELARQGFAGLAAFYHHMFASKGLSGLASVILSNVVSFIKFLSDANIALLIAVIFGIYALGIRRGRSMSHLMDISGKAISAISMIIFIIGAGGAFSQVLKDSHVTEYIRSFASGIHMSPLLMAFIVASIFRIAIGSATVATLTTAPIMLPIAQQTGVSPELMVLATGAGSVMWSHFNDTGFWMFKEYFNLSIKQTFLTWTAMECIIGITGITIVLLMNMFI
ncbi:MAG: Na+/H+ antiporter NhaC family protein [Bacteroidales bacterium]|jgi:Gnt-I system high-affinity gluconate transporter/Gnt-II system L-idonate transporter